MAKRQKDKQRSTGPWYLWHSDAQFLWIHLFIIFQAKVQRVIFDGIDKTKNDILEKSVKPIFSSKTFAEVFIFPSLHKMNWIYRPLKEGVVSYIKVINESMH